MCHYLVPRAVCQSIGRILFFCLGILLLAGGSQSSHAQNPKSAPISKSSGAGITLDGILDEAIWESQVAVTGFERNFPDDTTKAVYQTEVKLFYDEDQLYIGAVLRRNPDRKYAISTLQIDFPFYENDAFGVILDPFGDKTNGIGYYVNAGGAWRDEQISSGFVADATIDYKWAAEVFRTDDFWSVEMRIPFKSIRYHEGRTWNVNFVRNDVGANERSSWVRTPINFLLGNLAFAGSLRWDEEPEKMKAPVFLIPSLAVMHVQDDPGDAEFRLQPSIDSKIALSSAVNLDLTVNPDFSQTKADVLQLNLTRFELVFPEQRLFFLENSDLFGSFGNDSWGSPLVRPFFSRRIGLRYDSTFHAFVPTRILGGARLTGKLNNDLRFGAMSVLTAPQSLGGDSDGGYAPAQNYSVLAFQQKILNRSNIAAMVVNRQAFGNDSTRQIRPNGEDYNRLVALEFNFASRDDKLSGKTFYHVEFKDYGGKEEYARGAVLHHNTQRWRNSVGVSQISKAFSPEVGLVPRNDVLNANVHAAYSFYPKKGMINQWEFLVNPHMYYSASGRPLDLFYIGGVHAITRKTEDVWLVHIREKISLLAPFDPTFGGKAMLDSGGVYSYDYLRFSFTSDQRQVVFGAVTADVGEYFDGRQFRISGNVKYRLRPYANIGANYDLGYFRLGEPEVSSRIALVGVTTDLTFTRSLFFTSMVQYASLSEHVNVFGRFQWRFRPLSDFFVIYSSNIHSATRATRNQNLVAKVTWWI